MSQKRARNYPQTNWRGDPDIISMETRILPKGTPPRVSRNMLQVHIPVRSSSATTESSICFPNLQKRPNSSDSSIDPTPSKRHRVDILESSPAPKSEPEDKSSHDPITPNDSAASNAADCPYPSPDTAEIMEESPAPSVDTPPTQNFGSSYVNNLGDEMIIFRFGEKKKTPPIHRQLLRDHIPGFDEELNSMRPDQNVISLDKDMQNTIGLLIGWCYQSTLPKSDKTTTIQECFNMIKLYCLADRYNQVDLMNQIIDWLMRFLRKNRTRWEVECVPYAYANTRQGSPIRTLLVKWFLHKFFNTKDKGRWTTDLFYSAASAHPDLLRDVMLHMRSMPDVKFANPKEDDPEDYHVTLTKQGSVESQAAEQALTVSEVLEDMGDYDPDSYADEEENNLEDDELPHGRRARRKRT